MPVQASSPPDMSLATRDILAKVRRMVPPMLDKFHKGQHGRVAVIGGSEDYTGAPYFSAMASARLGCDMSHVICTPTAAAVIKTYSPNLMVHPLMRQTPDTPLPSIVLSPRDTDAARIAEPIIAMLPRLHVLVVGPGLGRDRLMHDTAAAVLRAAREKGVPAVLDADALQIVQRDPGLVRGWRGAVLTPNVVEFGRLCGALGVDAEGAAAAKKGELQSQGKGGGGGDGSDNVADTSKVEELARALGGVTVIQKGKEDYISNGETTLTVDLAGGRKRSGGQGDTLTGAIATFLGWRKAYLDRLWEPSGGEGEERLSEHELVGLAAFGASAVTKECSRLAFAKRGRSLQASDLTDEVHTAFLNLFGDDEDGDDEPGERSGSSKL